MSIESLYYGLVLFIVGWSIGFLIHSWIIKNMQMEINSLKASRTIVKMGKEKKSKINEDRVFESVKNNIPVSFRGRISDSKIKSLIHNLSGKVQ